MTTEKKPRTLLEPVAYRCMLRLPAAARFAENARPAIDDALAEAYALGAASRASPDEGRAPGPRCDSEPVRTSLTAPPLQCGLSSWPLDTVLERLADAADHLRGDHGCDAHGHEGVLYAAQAARLHIAALRSPPPEPPAVSKEGERHE